MKPDPHIRKVLDRLKRYTEIGQGNALQDAFDNDILAALAWVKRLEEALERIRDSGGLFADPASGQHARAIARNALEPKS